MDRDPKAQRLVLASSSPRRLDLLRQVGIQPDEVVAAEIDETPEPRELPADIVLRLAEAKARKVAADRPDAWILAADTVVACGRRILPKPDDEATARACLDLLSGRRHRVYGGICVIDPAKTCRTRRIVTMVAFKRLTDREKDDYLASGEWCDKAGAYAIQGAAGAFVTAVNGSYFNVVGLPLYETLTLLEGMGFCRPRRSGDG